MRSIGIRIAIITVVLAASALGNCAMGPVNGILFTSTSFAGEFNPANDVPFAKEATGCQHMILGLAAFGTAGAGKIAMDAGIKRIALVDHSAMHVLTIVYGRYCTRVVGE